MRYRTHKEQVADLAGGQCGRVTVAQLNLLGLDRSRVARWIHSGYLQPILPRVYAVGHAAPSSEADLWAAVLYAGPGAMLSHGTAARWLGLIDYAPRSIHVSTAREKRSLHRIQVHARRRDLERHFHKGIPVTAIQVTMLDLAATSGPRVLNRALGQLDFQKLLDVDALLGACGHGRVGAAALRVAIDAYDPRHKYANGRLEEDFLDLCKLRGLPLPVLNTYVHNIKVDACWPQQGLVVELDSELSHSSPGQRRRDRRNDLTLRSDGLTALRYDWDLVHELPSDVYRDVVRMLERLVAERRGRRMR
jgi:very-short-patch-repair endonuclease